MKYYFSKTLKVPFEDAIKHVTEGLRANGFGVITEIPMHLKLKEKLDVDFKKYTILGACNPSYAFKALQLEDKIGTMLPCNFLVIQQEHGVVEVAAINPVASMMAIANRELYDVAHKISKTLRSIVENV